MEGAFVCDCALVGVCTELCGFATAAGTDDLTCALAKYPTALVLPCALHSTTHESKARIDLAAMMMSKSAVLALLVAAAAWPAEAAASAAAAAAALQAAVVAALWAAPWAALWAALPELELVLVQVVKLPRTILIQKEPANTSSEELSPSRLGRSVSGTFPQPSELYNTS